jgi:hypothetical protein
VGLMLWCLWQYLVMPLWAFISLQDPKYKELSQAQSYYASESLRVKSPCRAVSWPGAYSCH